MDPRFEQRDEAGKQKRHNEKPPQAADLGSLQQQPGYDRQEHNDDAKMAPSSPAGFSDVAVRRSYTTHCWWKRLTAALFRSIGSLHDDIALVAVAGHHQPPRVAAHLAVLHQAPANIVFDEDLDVFAAIRTSDGEFSQS